MGNYLDKDGLTRFKEKMLTEVDKRIASGGGSTSGGDVPTKEEIIEGATRVTDIEVNPEVATVERLQTAVATIESNFVTVESNLDTIESNLDTKLENSTVHLIDSWSNGTFWYRKWSDGWIEQGGLLVYSASDDDYFNVTVTLPLPFSNTNYSAVATGTYTKQIAYSASICSKKTTTQVGFTVHVYKSVGYPSFYCCGY